MVDSDSKRVDNVQIKKMLDAKKGKMKMLLSFCAHCSLCAESCFLYRNHNGDPQYMPSYKVINSLGRLYKKKGKVDRVFLEEMSFNDQPES